MEDAPLPHSIWRIVAAFLFAPLVAAVAMAAWFERGVLSFDEIYMISVFGAYPATLLLGLPTFFFLRKRARASPLNCALAGACVAAAPWLAIGLIFAFHSSLSREWINQMEFVLEVSAFGALGGCAFWLIALARVPRDAPPRL
jgi:hypothetical protein